MKYYLGIDLGGTKIKAGVVNQNYEIIAEDSADTLSKRGESAVIDDMAKLAYSVLDKAGVTLEQVKWVGVGAPGTANKETGEIEFSNNLDWHHVKLVDELGKRLKGKKIFIENDANAAAYGEYIAGSAKDANISVMVTLGTGVGGGIIIDNQIYTGSNFAGAELGHTVIEYQGEPCTCGRKGCLESYASVTALIRMTKEAMLKDKSSKMWEICGGDIDQVNGKTSFDGMRAGDKTAIDLVDTYVGYVACGIANIINIFQPDILSIGGGISNERDTLLSPLRDSLTREVYSRTSEKNTEIVVASLRNKAGVIGAALLGKAN